MKKQRPLSVESLESRRVLAASLGWDGPGSGSADLTYFVGEGPDSVSQAEFETAIETALNAWAGAADIQFTQTDQPGLRDSLDFTSRPLDGRGGTLAQAYFPDDINPAQIAGDIQFDSADPWEIGNALGGRAFDLVAVAVHEVGHALGLEHTHVGESILRPTISPLAEFTSLDAHDIEAIQELYAPATSNAPEVETPAEETPSRLSRFTDLFDDRSRPDQSRPLFRWTINLGNFNLEQAGGFGVWFGNLGTSRGLAAGFSPAFNFDQPNDVNGDAAVSSVDALIALNALNRGTSVLELSHNCDTNGDGTLSAVDVLGVINALNQPEEEPVSPEASDESVDVPESEVTESELDAVEFGELDNEHAERSFAVGLGRPGLLNSAIDSLFESFDSNDDGNLTEDEVPDFMWRYLTREGVDADGDSRITLAEIDQALENQRLDLFNRVDDDSNGLLTEEEIPAFAWRRLENADTNDDNGLSFDELETFRSLSRFEQLDDNGDGALTQNEVSERAWDRLSRFDDNGDGEVTADELPDGGDLRSRAERFIDRLAERAGRIFRFIRDLRSNS